MSLRIYLPGNEGSKMHHVIKVLNNLHIPLIVKGGLRPEVDAEENFTTQEQS
jgi:hypothetical protein